MKQWIALLLAAVLAFSLFACGKGAGPEPEKNPETSRPEQPQQQEQTPEGSGAAAAPETETEKKSIRRSIGIGIFAYVDCPAAWPDDDNVNTRYVCKKEWFDPGTAVIGLTTYGAGEYVDSLDIVPQKIGTQFVRDVQQRCAGALHEANAEILSTEAVTINGFEGIQFTGKVFNPGKLSDNAAWDCHIYGYAFIIEGTAVTVTGIVAEQAQSPALIAEVDAAVDAMAATIRTTK